MLKAIQHSKAGRLRVSADENRSWRDVFQQREDLLTAMVFGRLLYLSSSMQEKILMSLLGERANPGEIINLKFWPRLSVTGIQELEGRSYVEPDIWIHCEHLHIVIEIKPPFGGWQSAEQWKAEVLAVNGAIHDDAALDDEIPRIALVAIGNVPANYQQLQESIRDCIANEFSLTTKDWPELCRQFSAWYREAAGTDKAVIADVIEAFELFGMARPPLVWESLISMAKAKEIPKLALLKQSGFFSYTKRYRNWVQLVSFSQKRTLDTKQCKKSLLMIPESW